MDVMVDLVDLGFGLVLNLVYRNIYLVYNLTYLGFDSVWSLDSIWSLGLTW
jgi:hypothetical protein